jgi:hypothetical protein
VVDASQLDDLAQRLTLAARRAREESVDVEVAASAVMVGTLGAGAGSVGLAVRLREQALQCVRALAAVVLLVAQGYRETERQLCAQIAGLMPGLAEVAGWGVDGSFLGGRPTADGSGLGWPVLDGPTVRPPGAVGWGVVGGTGVLAGAAGVGLGARASHRDAASGRADRPWWGQVEHLLAGLQPGLLEGLLVSTPALARLVVEAPPPSSDSPAGQVAAALRRAALLGPQQGAALVAAQLATLTPRVRRTIALLHPALMTSAAAAPTADRFAASRVLVAADLARLHEQRLLARAPAGTDRAASGSTARLDERIAWEHRLLDEEVELRHRDGSVTRHSHQLLQFDPSGDGRIVEVIGDLDHATHVAVFVPGTGSDLDRYPGTFARMTPFAAASPGLAVVVWQGADHPDQPFDDGLPSPADGVRSLWDDPLGGPARAREWPREHVLGAGLRDAADVAGPALARDVAGLRAAAPGPTSDLTVLGHSYGGSIVGSAELHGMVADRVVHIASAGAYVKDIAAYPATAARTQRFSMTAYDDPIRLSQGHDMHDAGPRLRQLLPLPLDPLTVGLPHLASDAFGRSSQVGHGLAPDLLPGVVRLDTGVHDDGTLVAGHSGMFAPHSTAWRNLLAVMTRGDVEVLEPQRWASHLEPLQLPTVSQQPGHPTVPGHAPRYVVDRSPYGDPGYRPPVVDLGDGP